MTAATMKTELDGVSQTSKLYAPDNPYVLVAFESIEPSLTLPNVRRQLGNLASLESSIQQYGLLENLVGIEIPEERRISPERWVELRAGHRRYEAVRRMREDGRWPLGRPLPFIMRDSTGFWEQLVENLERRDVRPWDIGRRLAEAATSETHRDIAYRIGKSAGYVDRHIIIGTGLHGDAVEFIETQKLEVPLSELVKVAMVRDRYGDPDGPEQVRMLGARKRNRRPVKRTKSDLHAFSARITHLENNMPIPPLIRPVVAGVLAYLKHGGRPNFRAIADQVVGERRRLFGDDLLDDDVEENDHAAADEDGADLDDGDLDGNAATT